LDSLINYFDKYSEQLFVLQVGFLVIILSVFVWVWYYNRKKYNHLKHQIPASVVKNYLDSIIQNSTALKSSLFRGGGLDVDPNNIPSVMPLSDLPGGTIVGLDGGGDAALKAQIAQLQAQLAQKQNQVNELEAKNAGLEGTVKQKQERIVELEKLLAAAQAKGGGGADPALAAKLDAMTKERDALKEELQQYDVISDDLANMKRLKQENEQLRKALNDAGGSVAIEEPEEEPAPVMEEEPEEVVAEAPVEEEVIEEEVQEEEPVVAAAAPEASEESGDDKSPEDLLSEFEKMLG
jgi:hypothetical protein